MKFFISIAMLTAIGAALLTAIILFPSPDRIARAASEKSVPAIPKGTIQSQIAEVEPVAAAKFSWASLESTDFKTYIANLRVFGCPEQTIRDIIVAEVNKFYEPREAPLKFENFVASGRQLSRAGGDVIDLERMRQLREVHLEKRALLKEL